MEKQPKFPRSLVVVGALALAVSAAALVANPESARADEQARRHQDQRPTIEVAFVLDTTGSMGGLLEGAKQKIWSIASRMAEGKPTPHIRVGLVAYKDVGDSYVTRKFDLTEDLDAVYANLKTFEASGGGDWPEHVGRGLGEAVSGLSWSQEKKAMRMIFVVGDAPPQSYQDEWDYRTWARKAIAKGIVVNTVRCGDAPDTEVAWREMSKLADGAYVSIGQTGGMVATATPFDGELAKLNSAISDKTIWAGSSGARSAGRAKSEEVSAMGAEAAADRIGFLGKSGGGAPAAVAPAAPRGALDLSAAPAAIVSLADDELDAPLRAMSKDARKAHVEKLAGERTALQQQAIDVSRKRDEWISKNKKAPADAFDAKVMESVKTRAADIGVVY